MTGNFTKHNFTKHDLRKIYKEKRNALYKDGCIPEISDKICKKIIGCDFFKGAEHILIFYPKGSELNVLQLLDKHKKFYLPKCFKDNLLVCPYDTGDELLLNKYKIYEPVSKPISDLGILDIIIVSALCADKDFNRVGYGAGYYDRFFENKSIRAKKVIIVPDDMFLDKIPSEIHDKRCDIIITEKRILENATGTIN